MRVYRRREEKSECSFSIRRKFNLIKNALYALLSLRFVQLFVYTDRLDSFISLQVKKEEKKKKKKKCVHFHPSSSHTRISFE